MSDPSSDTRGAGVGHGRQPENSAGPISLERLPAPGVHFEMRIRFERADLNQRSSFA